MFTDGQARFLASRENEDTLRSALAWIRKVDPSTADKLTSSPWTVSVDGLPYPALGVTYSPPAQSILFAWTIDYWATENDVPVDKACALVLVHEHRHLEPGGRQNEPASIKATAEFTRKWPAGQDRDNALSAVLKDLEAVDSSGQWKALSKASV